MVRYLIYGANGYTGSLIARMATARGHRPILAGRNLQVRDLAAELGLESRLVSLDDASALDAALEGVSAVLHCAGPFSRTADPMARACLRTRRHYLDITGEIGVFEHLASLNQQARTSKIVLMPGVGFDVVPTDCLAAHLKQRLPDATHLALAFQSLGGVSRGTATTLVENLHRGGAIRRNGLIVPVPSCWKTRAINFRRGRTIAITIPWGDVATAWHTTGIPNIETYVAAPLVVRMATWLSRPFTSWLAASPVQRWLKARIQGQPPGPTDEQRLRGRTYIWGEVRNAQGQRKVSRLRGPEGYTTTALTALAIVEGVLEGRVSPGYQTPARAFGADLILGLPGFERIDE
ncbi:MAG: saccharopine dehydrogenase NADP-binding domain-containing protein [Gemmataceae bacterium]